MVKDHAFTFFNFGNLPWDINQSDQFLAPWSFPDTLTGCMKVCTVGALILLVRIVDIVLALGQTTGAGSALHSCSKVHQGCI